MGCSDVSEFEHIYGQIYTTPSCVYDRLFTWTIMVDFNALIVWKTLIYICFSVKSSLWTLIAAYTKFRRIIWSTFWSCGHRSRSPMCTVLLPHRNAGRLHWGKAESIQLCYFGWVKPLQVLKRLFRQQFWWHWCRFDEEIMTLFCANNMTSNIQRRVTLH